MSSPSSPQVLTYYRALTEADPSEVRRGMLARPWRAWRDDILSDLREGTPPRSSHPRTLDSKQAYGDKTYTNPLTAPPRVLWDRCR